MTKRKTVGLLLATYNWPQALNLVLESVSKQTRLPDEILIGDDGSNEKTWEVIERFSRKTNIPIAYEWQEDRGFRKSIILNKVMKKATADYIIQIDGDIILHRNFIEDHLRNAEKNRFVQGCRALLGDELTRNLLRGKKQPLHFLSSDMRNRFNAMRIPALSFLMRSAGDQPQNIKACNIAYWREDFVSVNGYDNSFDGWGWEDDEFAARLINKGIYKKRVKLAAICYHLQHGCHSRYHLERNQGMFVQTLLLRRTMAENGLAQV